MKQKRRAILNEVFARLPVGPLYHYTNQRGFLGIVRDKQVWATHTQYLNDRREFSHAVEPVAEEIRRQIKSPTINVWNDSVKVQTALRWMLKVTRRVPTLGS